ncbi:hypothetical protein [Mycobacterium spongiae]|uniref:Uncharacterized protein n=1 Tax=Mycobacterium spongiae TaxID=886343 RepID=A0A975PXK0_9MYCO|nr:hypothetical protein [Mycobacterium spongiae]QUR67904.1 hypothetical protein F6B93_13030 [Mycobacterium spongiae]
MQLKRIYLTAILAGIPAAAAAMLAGFIASPPHVQLSSAPLQHAPRDIVDVDVDVDIPKINGIPDVIPDIPVPNINLPSVKINPGHVGAPGRGR